MHFRFRQKGYSESEQGFRTSERGSDKKGVLAKLRFAKKRARTKADKSRVQMEKTQHPSSCTNVQGHSHGQLPLPSVARTTFLQARASRSRLARISSLLAHL